MEQPAKKSKAEVREGSVERKTKETEISVSLNIDGRGSYDVNTGIGFLDHMISALAKHARFDLKIECKVRQTLSLLLISSQGIGRPSRR